MYIRREKEGLKGKRQGDGQGDSTPLQKIDLFDKSLLSLTHTLPFLPYIYIYMGIYIYIQREK